MFQKLIHWVIGKPQPAHYQLGNSQSCIFCGAYSTNRSDFDIVWEVRIYVVRTLLLLRAQSWLPCIQDQEFVAFRDIRPSAQQHMQLIPKTHIGELHEVVYFAQRLMSWSESIRKLSQKDVKMRERFRTCCISLISHLDPSPENGGNRTFHSWYVQCTGFQAEVSQSLLGSHPNRDIVIRMGFHIPPFNSVLHLHLHVQALPYISPIYRLKYPFVRGFGGYEKGFSWFAEIGQAIRILEKGHRVTVAPC